VRFYKFVRAVTFALLSPWAEKNPARAMSVDAPYVFSMSRAIVTAFAYGMYQQMRTAGIAGWPEATLCIALVYAIPVLNALSKVSAQEVVAFGSNLINRFGIGEVRTVGTLLHAEPNAKHDDERGEHTEREDVG
jgi:hypothetical protein